MLPWWTKPNAKVAAKDCTNAIFERKDCTATPNATTNAPAKRIKNTAQYMCTTCEKKPTFTFWVSARRHNKNLHNNTGTIVPLVENPTRSVFISAVRI
jgi:hypothetical protein